MTQRKGWSEQVTKAGLGDLGADYAEVVLDQWLDNGILRELPGIKTFLGLVRGALSIRDALFIKKVQRFIESIDKHSDAERESFAREFDEDPKYRERVTNAIVLLLDQLDDMDKPILLARAFSAFVRKEVKSFYYFKRYGEIIKAANVTQLQNLYLSLQEEGDEDRPVHTFVVDQVLPLSSLGLVELSEPPAHFGRKIKLQRREIVHYVFTDFGRLFIKIVIRKEDIEAG